MSGEDLGDIGRKLEKRLTDIEGRLTKLEGKLDAIQREKSKEEFEKFKERERARRLEPKTSFVKG